MEQLVHCQLATNPSDFLYQVGTIVVPAGVSPFLLSGQFVLYSALAWGAFALIPVTLSLVVRKVLLVPLIPFMWVFMSHFWQSNRFIFKIDLIPRLFYGIYFESRPGSSILISLPSSLLYLSTVGIGLSLVGAYIVRRVDF